MPTAELTEADAASFRERVVAFLDEHAGAERRSVATARDFLGAAAAAGLGGIVYPREYGGAGLTSEHDRIWRAEKSKYPPVDSEFVISHGMCLPVVNDFGTEDQKRRFMPDMISGRTMWCQMFSEPGAGSDVASLQSRAIRDGDEWILNGQKVWTTLAHRSDYGIVIARTDPTVPKHAGISMFIVDMRAPGVEIRPIHQIDGGTHFNEVFFTDVRIPADFLIGQENNGWNQATAMLMYERVAIGAMGGGGLNHPTFDRLVGIARKNGALTDPVVRDRLVRLYSMEVTKSMVSLRTKADVAAGRAPGPGGSLGKLMGSNIAWYMREVAHEIVGMAAVADDPDGPGVDVWTDVLSSFQAGIAGGTDEIQRNIIGDRVLGLPRDVSVDKGVPFNELRLSS